MLTTGLDKDSSGFTLVEALLSIVILAVMSTVISALYIGGLRTLNAQGDRIVLLSHLRGQMELLQSQPFGTLAGGSTTITVRGKTYTIDAAVAPADLDGDAVPETDARLLTVTVAEAPELSLSAIVVDHKNKLGKI